jgi:hypothetical protein
MENGTTTNTINISQKIPRYPLNGHSNYLIDKFYIFGYDSITLKKYLYNDDNIKNFSNDKKNDDYKFKKFQIDELPGLLNEYTSDYEKECLEIDMIREMILPKKVNLYYVEEEKYISKSPDKRRKRDNKNIDSFKKDKKEEIFSIYDEEGSDKRNCPPSYNVIFSSNPQSGNNSKKSINGFAYIFYKKLRQKKEISKTSNMSFYVPIIFCIISEFPFYNSFYQLCMQLEYIFSNNELRIPLEIIIYNIINLSPSPLNGEVSISLISLFNYGIGQKLNTISMIKDIIVETNEDTYNDNSRMTTRNDKNVGKDKNMNHNIALKRNSDIKYASRLSTIANSNILKHLKTISVSQYQNNNIKQYSSVESLQKIKFDFLTGYPLIQYNLAKVLLQTLSPIDIIDIFLYTFLEKDVLFFSKDLEYLSLIINSFLNLNFPLNDEKYYFINACVSFDNYINGNSTFVGSTFTTIIGINDSYNQKYQSGMNKLKDHIAVDLDNGKVYKVDDKSDKEKNKKNKDLFNYIKSCCKNRENKKILSREVYLLNKVLSDIYYRMNDKEDTNYYNIFKFNTYIDYSEDNIKTVNLQIQDSFYRFINNLCLYVYQNLSIKTEADDMKLKNENRNSKNEEESEMNVLFLDDYKEDENYSKEELYFIEELKETMKFQSFVYSFVQSYNPIDLYKIPLTFTEEFISIISRKSTILEGEINFLSLIDNLYKMNSEKEKIINLEEFLNEYYSDYKSYFDRVIQDICESNKFNNDKIKLKNYNIDNNIIIKYKSYELDDRILLKYLHILNTLENEEKINPNYCDSIYLSLKKKVQKNIPKNISVTEIETVIENYTIEQGILSESDLCSANIIILFTLSFRKLKTYVDCQSFLGSLFQDFTVFRKYYSMIMSMIYKVYEESMEKKDFTRAKDCFFLYYLCINSLRNVKLIPNESLMNIIKKFNKVRIDSLGESKPSKEKDFRKKSSMKLYGEDLPEDEITNRNLYVTHNFNKMKVYKEKEIVEKINEPNNSKDFFITFDGSDSMQPKIKFNNGRHTLISFFYSQKLLLLSLVEEYQRFIVDTNEEVLKPKIILDACLNIFIFMRNSKDFTDKSDIFEMVKVIFYIFLNYFHKVEKNK